MSQKKDKEKSQRNASESAVKAKPAAPKLFTFKMRDNGARRDVGIQMRLAQDGKNLSLMEVDILRSTGCKWSKILYPGFKGYIKPQDKTDKFNSAEKYSNLQPLSQNMQNLNQFMHSFNQEYNKIVDSVGAGLRNSCSSTSNEKASAGKSFGPTVDTSSNVKTLQQRILEGNFHEPKSLFAKGPVNGAPNSNFSK